MGLMKAIVFVCCVFLLYIESTHAGTMAPTTMWSGGGGGGGGSKMEDWKLVAIIVPCVVGGLSLLICLMCCCCCQGGAAGGGMMCCDPNYCNACCGPMCDPAMCCGPHCCGPMCDPAMCCGPQCCGPMCDPAMCCGPQCCGPCCYVAPVTTAPVTQYATRSQIWPQQACTYNSSPVYGGGAACGPCGQQPRGGAYRY